MNLEMLAIYSVQPTHADCCVCGAVNVPAWHRDRDFGHAFVCGECSGFVIMAEVALTDAGFFYAVSEPNAETL